MGTDLQPNGHKALDYAGRESMRPELQEEDGLSFTSQRSIAIVAKNGHKALDYVKRESTRPGVLEEDGHRSTTQWAYSPLWALPSCL